MHPLFSPIHRLIAYLSVWILLSGFWALYMMNLYVAHQSLADFAEKLVFCLPATVLLGLFVGSAFFLVRSSPISSWRDNTFSPNQLLKHLYRWLVTSLVISAIWTGICATWQSFLESFQLMPLPSIDESLLEFTAANLIYLINLLAYECYFAIVRSLEAQQATLAAKVTAREAELTALRHQLDPHFLFNCLNAVSALCVQQPQLAREMTLELANYFRQTLNLGAQQKISLQQEIDLCHHYLKIESIRFGDKLISSVHVEPELLNVEVPPLLIQPLLENAVKHGISQMTMAGAVNLNIHSAGSQLRILITNSCSTNNAQSSHKNSTSGLGLGLNNLRERLDTLYGQRAGLSTEKSDGCFSVQIALPIEPQSSFASRDAS